MATTKTSTTKPAAKKPKAAAAKKTPAHKTEVVHEVAAPKAEHHEAPKHATGKERYIFATGRRKTAVMEARFNWWSSRAEEDAT